MKKLVTLLLAVMMLLTLTVPVLAGDATTIHGSITIEGASDTATYEIYRLLDMESFDPDKKLYTYKASAKWGSFFETTEAKQYFKVDEQGYITWGATDDAATVSAAASMMLQYAKESGILPDKSNKTPGDYEKLANGIKFSDLTMGYYLLDSTIGVLCGLTATKPDVSVVAKNHIPTVDKQVMEDSGSTWGTHSTADIGQDVEFRVSIKVHDGAQNFILHDKMADGLTFKGIDRIEHQNPDAKGEGGVTTTLTSGVDYSVVVFDGENKGSCAAYGEDCSFEVVFTETLCDNLETNDWIYVYYTAMLNRNAEIGDAGNANSAILSFGDLDAGHYTAESTTITRTYGIDVVKTDTDHYLIDGAKFKIYDAATGGNEIAVVLMEDGVTYRRARADEIGVEIDVDEGIVRIVGFDNGRYYLEETAAPSGYTKLASRVEFIISDNNWYATVTEVAPGSKLLTVGSGIEVVNKAGSVLPETGGFGTTLFITVGTILVLGAGVLLVTKKRMANMVG